MLLIFLLLSGLKIVNEELKDLIFGDTYGLLICIAVNSSIATLGRSDSEKLNSVYVSVNSF